MGIEVFLGEPPQHIKEWIINNSKPAGNPKTKIMFTDGTSQEYDWSGKINSQTMIDAGIWDAFTGWTKNPQTVEIGTNATNIDDSLFLDCIGLTSVTIPDSVTSIGRYAFYGCSGLTSVTFSGKDKATVQNMANYSWGLNSNCVIHCTDGDITI